jgi:predicted component of type VI protein secretion system
MRTETLSIFKIDELSGKAQQRAFDDHRDSPDYPNDSWSENEIEDAKTIAALFGLEIDQISFSGFSSQGDGASFTGRYKYEPEALPQVKEHAPLDTELHKIVEDLEALQGDYCHGLSAAITRDRTLYAHEGTMNFEITGDHIEDFEPDYVCENRLEEIFKDYARWIYRQLNKQYDYEMSDDAVLEDLQANEYEFLENGKRYQY